MLFYRKEAAQRVDGPEPAFNPNSIVKGHDSAKYDTLVAAQGAMIEFMAAVADILREEAPEQNSVSAFGCRPLLQ